MSTLVSQASAHSVLLERYPDIARSVAFDDIRTTARRIDFGKQFFMAAGVPIIPCPPRQPVHTVAEAYQSAADCAGEYIHTVQEYTRKSGADGFVMPDTKRAQRTIVKANDDYEGDVSRVCDIHRSTITISKPDQYRKLSALLSPANNRSVVRFEDGFASPDKDGGLRRILANVAMSNGHITEVQVRHAVMEKAYDKTATLWRDIRAMRARLETAGEGSMSNAQIEALAKSLNHKEQKRLNLHEVAAKKMAGVVIDRSFYLVEGFPVMVTYDRYTKEHAAVVPDITSGRYVTDNRFLPLVSDADKNVQSVARDVFISRSWAIVSSPAAKACVHVM